jgi:hypothetical protein
LTDGSRFEAESKFGPLGVKEAVKAVKYFPSAVNLVVDWAMFSKIHCLQFYPHRPFSHRVDTAIRMYDQTWTFRGVHCRMAELSREWNRAMSSRFNEVGSGLSRPAEKDAFAIAS